MNRDTMLPPQPQVLFHLQWSPAAGVLGVVAGAGSGAVVGDDPGEGRLLNRLHPWGARRPHGGRRGGGETSLRPTHRRLRHVELQLEERVLNSFKDLLLHIASIVLPCVSCLSVSSSCVVVGVFPHHRLALHHCHHLASSPCIASPSSYLPLLHHCGRALQMCMEIWFDEVVPSGPYGLPLCG